MALQVLSILSASKVGLDIDAQTEPAPQPTLTPTQPTQAADRKPKAPTDSRTRSPVQAKAKTSAEAKTRAATITESKPQLNKYFRLFLLELLKMFGTDHALLEKKGSFIIRQVKL